MASSAQVASARHNDLDERLRTPQLHKADSELEKKDLELVLEILSDHSVARETRGRAYIHLATLLLPKQDGAAAQAKQGYARRMIAGLIEDWISETSFPELAKAFAALTTLLEIDKTAFDEVLARDAMTSRIVEAGETMTAEYKIVDPEEYLRAKIAYAAFISQAAAPATALARKLANPDSSNWLYGRLNDAKEDITIRAAAGVAFIKMKTLGQPKASGMAQMTQPKGAEDDNLLYPSMKDLIKVGVDALALSDAKTASDAALQSGLELFGIASLKPEARREICKNVELLKRLITLGGNPLYHFSTSVIFANLIKYTHEGDAEDKMKDSLRRYASQSSSVEDTPESPKEMANRVEMTINVGIVPLTVRYSKATGVAVRRAAAQILLGLVEERRFRGLVIQQGGAKALLEIIIKSSIAQTPSEPAAEDLLAVQALAKLLITSNPLHVLGPTPQSPLLVTALRLLAIPVLAPETSSLLQRFESLMALTNIVSLSEDLAERLAKLPGMLNRMEDMMTEGSSDPEGALDGRGMCRRAATELLCNLVASETAFVHYTAVDLDAASGSEETSKKSLPGPVASRIRILIALSDCLDLPTRLAALGTLASLTLAPTVAAYIGNDETRSARLAALLEDADEGMQLRAVECIKNVCLAVPEAKSLLAALRALASNATGEVQDASKDALSTMGKA